jgi:hypothetical protein
MQRFAKLAGRKTHRLGGDQTDARPALVGILLIRCLHGARLVEDLAVHHVDVADAGGEILDAAIPHFEDEAEGVGEWLLVHGVQAQDHGREGNDAWTILQEVKLLDRDLSKVRAEMLELLVAGKERHYPPEESVRSDGSEVEAQRVENHRLHVKQLQGSMDRQDMAQRAQER